VRRILDGFHLRVRFAARVVVVAVLAALGVTETGQKQLVGLELAAAEATASWSGLLTDLEQRDLPAPLLVVTEGTRDSRRHSTRGRRLHDAQVAQSGGRCPVHARPELKRD
jgi:transposase-like protein